MTLAGLILGIALRGIAPATWIFSEVLALVFMAAGGTVIFAMANWCLAGAGNCAWAWPPDPTLCD